MKKILLILGIACLSLFFASCEKETEGISFETHYAVFELTGDNPFSIPLGTQYSEPGVKALAGTDELEVNSSNNVNSDQIGVYTVSYSATNKDGYDASASRTVVVYDPTAPDTDLSGKYVSGVVRTEADGSSPRPFDGLSVTVTMVGPGIFYVDCLLGGYYSLGAGYGSTYAMTGYIMLNSDNTLSLISSYVSGWGDGLEDFFDGVYDPATGGLSWKSQYAGSDIFSVTLTK
jgi:hypothetical protein